MAGGGRVTAEHLLGDHRPTKSRSGFLGRSAAAAASVAVNSWRSKAWTLSSCAISALLAFSLIDHAQYAWLFLPPALLLLALITLPGRLRRRTQPVGAASRLLMASPALLLLPHLPLTVPDLPDDLGAPRYVLIGLPAVCAALLAARAMLLPAGWLLPARRSGAVVLTLILSLNLLTYYDVLPTSDAAVTVRLPLDGEWLAGQAGRSLLTNHHVLSGDQNYAVDLVVRLAGGTTHGGGGQELEDYAAFGRPVSAPADGLVVRAVDDLPDVAIGDADEQHPVGNYVLLELGPDRFVLLAHLRHDSLDVEVGERVRAGTSLGRVGNSGNTTEPHLHLQAMTAPDQGRPLRLAFQGVLVRRGGDVLQAEPVELRRNDRVRAS